MDTAVLAHLFNGAFAKYSRSRLSEEFDRAFRRRIGPVRYGAWREDQHPRDDSGKFSDSSAPSNGSSGWESAIESVNLDEYEPNVYDGNMEVDVLESGLQFPTTEEILSRLKSEYPDVPSDPDELQIAVLNTVDDIVQDEFNEIKREEDEEEHAEWKEKGEHVKRAVSSVFNVAESHGWESDFSHQSMSSHSQYIDVFNDDLNDGYGERIRVRVSDHFIPAGSGFNQGTGERYSEPDVNLVVDENGNVDLKKLEQAILDAEGQSE